MSSSVQWNSATMGLPVFSNTTGAAGTTAGTTGGAAVGGGSCAHTAPHTHRSEPSFRLTRNSYLTMATKNPGQGRNVFCRIRRLLIKSPLRQRAHTHPYHPNAPATPTLGGYSSNIPSNSVVLRYRSAASGSTVTIVLPANSGSLPTDRKS